MNYLSNPKTFAQVKRAKGKATSVMKSVKKSVLNFPNRHEKDEKKKSDNDGAWWTGEGLTKSLSGLQKTSANGGKDTKQAVVNDARCTSSRTTEWEGMVA